MELLVSIFFIEAHFVVHLFCILSFGKKLIVRTITYRHGMCSGGIIITSGNIFLLKETQEFIFQFHR